MLSERPKASAVAVCCVSGWVWSGVGAGTDFGERFRREPGDGGRNGGSEPLEVDCRRSQESLDAHVVEAPPNGARKTVPGLGLAVDALDAPAVTLIEAFLPPSPLEPLASSPQQRRVVDIEDDDTGMARGADTARP